jgi:hypothetical protein
MILDVQATAPDSQLTPAQLGVKFRGHGIGELGQDETPFTYIPDEAAGVDNAGNFIDAAGNIIGGGTGSGGAGAGPIIGTLATDAMRLAQLYAIQPGTSISPYGIIRQTPGFPVPTPYVGATLRSNVSTGTGLALGAAALLGVILLLGMRKGRG